MNNFAWKIRIHNQEVAEPEGEGFEVSKKLECHIDNESNPINYLQDGIKLSLRGTFSKRSDVAGRDCLYMRTMEISKLPGYLAVHFVRFFWKKASFAAATKAGKAKILRVSIQIIT